MEKRKWAAKVRKACRDAGTYQKFFDPVIDTLAGILERRDAADELFEESGGHVIVEHTNKAGAKNAEQNPVLRLANDLNRDALAYWRELGLTPAGLRKISDTAHGRGKADSVLAKALEKLEGPGR